MPADFQHEVKSLNIVYNAFYIDKPVRVRSAFLTTLCKKPLSDVQGTAFVYDEVLRKLVSSVLCYKPMPIPIPIPMWMPPQPQPQPQVLNAGVTAR